MRTVDVLLVGASLSAAACAKRLVDAGQETVVLEKKKLPRHKICSGILAPRGHRFLLENFGPLPRKILHEPTSCRGVTFHFPSMLSLSMDFDGGPTPHLHRRYSDHWAIERSGVEVHDETSFISLKDEGDHVTVEALKHGKPVRYRARYVIGNDGPNSKVIREVYPDEPPQVPWFMVGQKFHEIHECPLDDDYFHFWFNRDLGYYTWSHARDNRQILGVGWVPGQNFDDVHAKLQRYVEEKHGVRLGPPEDREGCLENFGLSLINRYVFGKGNVLVAGQAAGFLNMMAEGMSCSLHSGAIAGEAAVEAMLRNRPVQQVYRRMIASEVRRCSDQWNPFKIAFARPHEADFREALKELKLRDQARMTLEIINFLRLYGHFNWGRQILGQAFRRSFLGGYDSVRWR